MVQSLMMRRRGYRVFFFSFLGGIFSNGRALDSSHASRAAAASSATILRSGATLHKRLSTLQTPSVSNGTPTSQFVTYFFVCIHARACAHTRARAHTHTHTHTHTHVYMKISIYVYTYIYTHIYMHIYVHSFMHTCIHAYIHTFIQI